MEDSVESKGLCINTSKLPLVYYCYYCCYSSDPTEQRWRCGSCHCVDMNVCCYWKSVAVWDGGMKKRSVNWVINPAPSELLLDAEAGVSG